MYLRWHQMITEAERKKIDGLIKLDDKALLHVYAEEYQNELKGGNPGIADACRESIRSRKSREGFICSRCCTGMKPWLECPLRDICSAPKVEKPLDKPPEMY